VLAVAKLGEAGANALSGATRGFALTVDGRAGVQRLDLA